MRIYLAGGIFFYGDYLRNTEWARKIREAFPGVYVYSPVENTDINGEEGKKKFAGSQEIANGDNIRLDNTDVLIACIDGDVLPSGTCAEIGKFHEKIARGDNKYIIGIFSHVLTLLFILIITLSGSTTKSLSMNSLSVYAIKNSNGTSALFDVYLFNVIVNDLFSHSGPI